MAQAGTVFPAKMVHRRKMEANKVTDMWGHSIQFWQNVSAWMVVAAFIFGGLAVSASFVSAWVSSKTSDAIQDVANKRIEEIQTKNREIQARSDEANAAAEIAKAEAARANLELARLKTPRALTSGQQASIAAKIKSFSGTTLDFGIVASDQDTVDLLPMIEDALTQAGWQPIAWVGGTIMYDRARSKRVAAGVISARGVSIVVEPEQAASFLPAAEALSAALNTEGIAAQSLVSTDEISGLSQNKTAIHILIGIKP